MVYNSPGNEHMPNFSCPLASQPRPTLHSPAGVLPCNTSGKSPDRLPLAGTGLLRIAGNGFSEVEKFEPDKSYDLELVSGAQFFV